MRSAPVVPSGGDIAAVRSLRDAYPTFNGIAVDPEHGLVIASDTNLKSVLVYNAARGSKALRQIRGEKTEIGFVAGIAVDPDAREIYAVNNDIEDSLNVFWYDSRGNERPVRRLSVPHQSWGIALSPARDEFAVSVEVLNAIMIYRRQANIVEPPRRVLRGPQTEIADPHGVFWDGVHGEIVVANHGNFRGLAKNSGSGCMAEAGDASREGQLRPPSITIYPASADGDVKPLRKIEGLRTRLDWPMGVGVDLVHDEIVVANNGDSSILVFGRSDRGDVAPCRVIRGTRTGIDHPIGVAIDPKNDGFWVANFGNHSAAFFPSNASGDAPPAHTIRNAPPGTPTVGFGNPMALAYDSKRKQILVPN